MFYLLFDLRNSGLSVSLIVLLDINGNFRSSDRESIPQYFFDTLSCVVSIFLYICESACVVCVFTTKAMWVFE